MSSVVKSFRVRIRNLGTTIGTVLVAATLMAGAITVQAARERAYADRTVEDESLYITSGPALRRLAFASNALAADLYWIRTIQYYGGNKRRLAALNVPPPPPLLADSSREYGLLYPLLDLTTTLDPRFNIAYRFGAVFLAEPYPGGPGRPDLAVKLLEKGLHARPDKWEYMEDIGFVDYWYRHDYRRAADWFQRASDVPGAPWWLRSLAATTLAEGGDRRSSRTMWHAIREGAEIDWLRHDAERRLAQLDALDQIDAYQQLVDRIARQTGEPAAGWAPLLRARVLRRVPLDPAGVPYELSGGRVHLSSSSPLWPLPDEPERLGPPPVS